MMTMMTNKKVEGTYSVDYVNNKIWCSKKFLKEASVIGTGAFEVMVVLKQTYPSFEVEVKEIEKKEDKISYEGLSVERMLAYITIEKEKKDVEEFERYIEIYTDKTTRNIQKGMYAKIKKLFLNRYKFEYAAFSESDERMADIDEKTYEIKIARENKKKAELKAIREAQIKAARNNVVSIDKVKMA